MAQDQMLRIPRGSIGVWAEVRLSIAARLSQRLKMSMDEIGPARIVEEMLRIAMTHIHGEGYPEPGQINRRLEHQRLQLVEMQELALELKKMNKLAERVAALEARLAT